MADKPAQAFLSYAHADDEFLDGGITWLRRELQRGMQALTGEPFDIFQDADGIAFGEHWPSRIEDALEGARFLVPILTPSYFTSSDCCAEAAAFLDLEHKAGRQDLILPIYLIEADILEDAERRDGNAIARIFHERQYTDWRNAAFDLRSSPRIKQRAFELAKQIKAASERVAKDAPPIVPAQGPGIRFGLDKDGKIDRVADEPSEVTDDDPRLCSLQEGLRKASDTFLNSFHGEAGRNAFGPLIDNVEAYREAITGPLTEIQLTDVYRYGLELQNWVLAGKRDIDRFDPRPDLEDHQQAALSNLLGLHGPFILSTKEGEVLQAKADQDQMTAKERASLWSPELSDAVQTSDHATERAKTILRDVNKPSEDGDTSNRSALLALATNRNFLSASGEAATGKVFADIGEEAVAQASRSAGGFLLKNEKLINKLAASTHHCLGWLGHLIGWLKREQADQPKRKRIVEVGLASESNEAQPVHSHKPWTPGQVFRDVNEPWCPEMVVIPAGEFRMGSPEDEGGRSDNEGPQHLVTLKNPFALGRYHVTSEQFAHFCEEVHFHGPYNRNWENLRKPVTYASWDEAKAFCDWLSEKTKAHYRVPTEAEWEYACRAGSTTAYACGSKIHKEQANFGSELDQPCEVGMYAANDFKLFDMHGNVWEWCEDSPRAYAAIAETNPTGRGQGRVVRGGSWKSDARHLRSACRELAKPYDRLDIISFRCARVQG